MLILSRRKDQQLILNDRIEITILDVGHNRVKFGIKAPKDIVIHTHLKGSPTDPVSNSTIPESVEDSSDPSAADEPPEPVLRFATASRLRR